ncbi:MAG TPA: hypothetical protein VJ998_09375 [Pseudomonadales bacterium]|nr:hypothetical protein [Pseudomonadales bacterium]
MNVFEMVVIIVIVSVVAGTIRSYFRSRHRMVSQGGHESLDEALDKIDDLEERVRVLERVVTDDKYDLKRQIDDLKD